MALPLCLGIALASGVPLFAGVIAGVVGGVLVSLLSGSELTVSGPAAGLVVIVSTAMDGLGSFERLGMAVILAGVLQVVLGSLRAGMLGDYVPNGVIKGMLAAIGVVIVLKQIPHALGDDSDFIGDEAFRQPDHLNTLTELLLAFRSPSPGAIGITVVSLLLLILWETSWVRKRAWAGWIPAPLLCVILGTLMNEGYRLWLPEWALTVERHRLVELPVATTVPAFLEMFSWPDFGAVLRPEVWRVAVMLALVGSIESLLCIEAMDKLDAEKRISDTSRELRAQGVGNVVSGLLGGLPLAAGIVRSSANVYAGARTRLACFVHGALMMLAVATFASVLNRIPLAALASVLLVVGYKLASRTVMVEMWRKGWTQFVPFAVTLISIVFTDLLVGIGIGLLSGLFFVVRSNHHASVTLVSHEGSWLLRFNKDMSFVNKAELKRRLREIPDEAHLIVDGTKALLVDRDIYETLKEFETAASFRGIRLEYHNLFGKHLGLAV